MIAQSQRKSSRRGKSSPPRAALVFAGTPAASTLKGTPRSFSWSRDYPKRQKTATGMENARAGQGRAEQGRTPSRNRRAPDLPAFVRGGWRRRFQLEIAASPCLSFPRKRESQRLVNSLLDARFRGRDRRRRWLTARRFARAAWLHQGRVRSCGIVIARSHRRLEGRPSDDGLWRRGAPESPGALRSPRSPRLAPLGLAMTALDQLQVIPLQARFARRNVIFARADG